MKILKVIDILRNKEIRLKVEDDATFAYREKILIKSSKESCVAEVFDMPRKIPGIKYDENFFFVRKLKPEELTEFETLQEGTSKRIKKAQELADKLELSMRFFSSQVGWHNRMTSFFFVAKNPVDFRELLKLLVKTFSGRIHLERVSERDRTRIIGGVGSCGRSESCCQFTRFNNQKVSLNAVRDQGIMINNNEKIFGLHGKIKTCMLYEIDGYRENRKYLPHMKQLVTIGKLPGRVVGLDMLNKKVKVLLENETIEVFDVKDVQYENKKDAPEEPLLNFEKYEISPDGIDIDS